MAPPDITWRPEVGKKVEKFFNDPGYKEYIENAVAFNRKLNEERKMRLPYIDGQTGVAQRHYNSGRLKRERMPPTSFGKVLQYPPKHWHKKRYQYLKYFMAPKQKGPYDSDAEIHTISQVENPLSGPVGLPAGALLGSSNGNVPPGLGMNEDSNHSGKDLPGGGGNAEPTFSSVGGSSGANSREGFRDSGGWNNYDNNMYNQDGGGSYDDEDAWDQDSGSDYDDFGDATYGSRSRRKEDGTGRSKGRSGRSKGRSGGRDRSSGGGMGGSSASKRRTHADSIPDSEKPFSCDRRSTSRRSTAGAVNYRESDMVAYRQIGFPPAHVEKEVETQEPSDRGKMKTMHGKEVAKSLGYCDFCLGDASSNKKTGKAEELVSCAECGRSG